MLVSACYSTLLSRAFNFVLCAVFVSTEHLPLHSFPTRRSSDLVPQHQQRAERHRRRRPHRGDDLRGSSGRGLEARDPDAFPHRDRKSTRLNSSHRTISYAVFCLKKKTLHGHST